LVVPLAVPDFSMPYNVICLTSTVLAVFMGGVLNALLWRPGRDEREAADPKTAIKKKRKKIARVVVLVVSFMAVAVYYDTDLQTEFLRQARYFGLYDPGPLPGDEL
jgi:phosphatidylinositol glycan class T